MHDIAIVGGGPIGLELTVALRAAGIAPVHFEAGQIGATIEWWAPSTRFFSSPERIEIAGMPLATVDQEKATRERYLAYLRSVVTHHDLDVRTFRRVVRIERGSDGSFTLFTRPSAHGVGGPAEARARHDDEADAPLLERTTAKRVVLAIGNMHQPRRLEIPGEDLPHVSHWFRDPHHDFRRRVLVVGGKNSAVEAAVRLYRCGADVVMSYRGERFDPARVKYWLRPEIEWLIEKQRIEFHPRTRPISIDRDRVLLGPIDEGGEPREVAAQTVLLLTGYVQDPSLFEQLGVRLHGPGRAPWFDTATMQTSVEGVYVAGTAAGGTQERTRFFIENTHVHVERIVRAVTGRSAGYAADPDYAALEES